MTGWTVAHPSVEERKAQGELALVGTPLDSHEWWLPAEDRVDPVTLLAEQNATRDADLVAVRHGRMMISPFTFYRGAAKTMAADLNDTPVAGLTVQLCGDAHLANFGVFASPERRLLFDLNDFDETLPGPFEFDVKRMATSFVLAARNNGFSRPEARAASVAAVGAYRTAMATFATMRTLDVWYAHLDDAAVMRAVHGAVAQTSGAVRTARKGPAAVEARRQESQAKAAAKRAEQGVQKAYRRDSVQALTKLGELVDGEYRIVSQPPIVVPLRDLSDVYGLAPDEIRNTTHQQLRTYRATLQDDRRHLLERFKVVDVARKVVGVGSVGTRAFIVLLQGRDAQDPLFLQIKEATASVLEPYLGRSGYRQHGERVVQGQRMMQAASDIFLGWTKGVDEHRHFYWRQLRDMKGSAAVESMTPVGLQFYGRICGWTLARAHARSGDPAAIAGYLGDTDGFEEAVSAFAERYADQAEQDHQVFCAAIESGRLEATEGL